MTTFVGMRIRLPKLSVAPSSPVAGDMYYNTAQNAPYVYNGTSWVAATASVSSGASVTYAADAPSSPAVGDIWVESDVDLQVIGESTQFVGSLMLMGG